MTVGSLRVRGVGLDMLVTRLQVQHALDAVELRPPGLPPSAILCVRAMRDPLPGALDLNAGGIRPSLRWERATRDELGRLAQQAARPAWGPVPAGAESVLFADRAELLAELARDWCAGMLTTRWWWRGLFPGDLAEAVAPAWLESPRLFPAALALVATRGMAIPFVNRLDEAAVTAFLSALAEGFGLPEVRDLAQSPAGAGYSRGTMAWRRSESPWRRWAPEASDGALDARREALLGVGLTLWRAPTAVRTSAFRDALTSWQGATTGGDSADWVDLHPGDVAAPATGKGAPQRTASQELRMAKRARVGTAVQLGDAKAPIRVVTALRIDPGLDSELHAENDVTAAPWAEAMEGAPPFSEVEFEATIDTAFGGLFYLLNLAIALDLYGDFTMPAEPGIELSPWDFLTMMGRRLLGEEITNDPIWPLLAMLAGRTSEAPPGVTFAPPDEWRLPPGWLVPFAGKACWFWHIADRRLRVAHEAGFPILDVPLTNRRLRRVASRRHRNLPSTVWRRLRLETAAYGETPQLVRGAATSRPAEDDPRERWLDWLEPYVRARLGLALGIDSADLPQVLLRHQARVFVSASNVDVVLSLAELPIAIRLCGLDRDPGWIPAAGRSLAFRFE